MAELSYIYTFMQRMRMKNEGLCPDSLFIALCRMVHFIFFHVSSLSFQDRLEMNKAMVFV